MKYSTIPLFFLFIPILVTSAFGDALPAPYYVSSRISIHGARIVSEGAYFHFSIKNTSNVTLQITMETPEEFGTNMLFFLYPNETQQINLVAPEIEGENFTVYTFSFRIINHNEGIDYTVSFPVLVVDLLYGYAAISEWRGESYESMHRQIVDLNKKVTELRTLLIVTTSIILTIGVSFAVVKIFKLYYAMKGKQKRTNF